MTDQQTENDQQQNDDAKPDVKVEVKPEPATGPNDKAVAKLEAEVERLRGIARKQEDRAKTNADKAKKLDDIEAASASELEKAVKAARDEERVSLKQTYHKQIAAAEVKAAAGGRLEDPNDAVIHIDTLSLINDDGEVDSGAVKKAIDELVAAKPYLEKKNARRVDYDGGARASGKTNTSEPGMGRMRDAYAQSSPTTRTP